MPNIKKIIILLILIFGFFSCNSQEKNYIKEKNNYKKIVAIPEASGICYMKKTDTYFVANDEGSVYEINKKGEILNKKYFGNYDFEGIVCNNKKQKLYLLIEDSGNLVKIDSKKLKIIGDYLLAISKKERAKFFDKKYGAEGLAFDGEYFYISTQKKDKNNLLKFSIQQQKNINPSHSHNLKLEKKYNIKSKDLSGLTFYNKELYILSDKKDKIYIYDLEKEKIKKEIKLEEGSWEGVDFDKNGEIFLADDDGEVVKYKN